jgi:hypothetical protein
MKGHVQIVGGHFCLLHQVFRGNLHSIHCGWPTFGRATLSGEGFIIEFEKVASGCWQELAPSRDELTAQAEGVDCPKTAPRASTPRLPCVLLPQF